MTGPVTHRELVVVGAGPAGMACALAAHEQGVRDILLIDRDQFLGGILNQCVHTGFGLTYFKEVLTGPEYAQRFIARIEQTPSIEVRLRTFAVSLSPEKELVVSSPGVMERLRARALVMACGCREKTREMIHIPGTRPAGIFSAGLAQKLINIEGLIPGKEAVIIGSGDIGLIMARRLILEGMAVRGLIEIEAKSRGLARNLAQCVYDFEVPVYFGHTVTRICGKDRVEAVEVARVNQDRLPLAGTEFRIPCDTVLVSVGLIPENELIEMAGARLGQGEEDQGLNTTSIPGLFVCGNAYKVYDVADAVTCDAELCGRMAAGYLSGAS